MILYYSNGSPFARKVRIVLHEKGIPFEADVDDRLRPIAESAGPTLAVPFLDDNGQQLRESDVIIDYLLRTYPDAQGASIDPPLSPWLTRPERHWDDMVTLATINAYADSMVNLRLMAPDAVTPANSDYMARQLARVDHCLDWLEGRVTDAGFAPGWFSIMDIAFICPTVYCETRDVLPWRGRPKLEALYERYQSRPSLLATPINHLPPISSRYIMTRTLI